MPTSPERLRSLLTETTRRRQLRSSLVDWCRVAGYAPAAHHRLLITELEALAAGTNDRLMVMMPPGSAKSTYGSVLFPAWWFTRHPASSVIAASHTAELAEHFGRQVRALVQAHGPSLGYGLAADNRAAARWQTTARGQYFATGVRGPITGRRADLAIIDDPIRSQAESDSATFRDQIWDWFRADLTTRLKPRGRVALIMTRWHEDDLGGRLLEEQGDQWRTLRLPALAGDADPLGRPQGAPLWPEWEDADALARKRALVGPRIWSALYQQDPRPPSGGLFQVGRIMVLDTLPALDPANTVRAWDLAASAQRGSNDPDWTVGLKLARDPVGRFVVLDVVRLRGEPHEVEQAILEAAGLDGRQIAIGLPQDPGAAGKSLASYLATLLAGHRLMISRESGSKETRATPVAAQAGAGNLLLARAVWNRTLLEELAAFPFGAKDDQVDALSRAFAMLIDQPQTARRLRSAHLAR